jgi:serine/threonine protein kinase
MSVLAKGLERLVKVGSVGIASKPVSGEVAGADNVVRFIVSSEIAAGSKTGLAISENRSGKSSQIKEANDVQTLFIDRGVDTRFLLTYLTYGTTGRKTSVKAVEGSLKDFIEKSNGQLTRNEINEIFAQILLGVQALHEKGLTHRDLKPGNILVSRNTRGELVAVVCDFDTVVPVDDHGHIRVAFREAGGSRPAPELLPFLDLKLNEWKTMSQSDINAYASLDFRAQDCYALGKILGELIDAAAPGEFSPDDPLIYLRMLFLRDLPEERRTVQYALQNYFDLPGQPRDEFFQMLQDRPSPYEYLGQYRARAFEPDNPFLNLKDHVRPVFQLIKALDKKFDFFDKMPHHLVDDFSLQILQKSFNEFYATISAAIEHNDFADQKKVLMQIRLDATKKMATIQLEYKPDIDKALFLKLSEATSKTPGQEVKHWELLAPLYAEVGKAQLLEQKTITPNVLAGIVHYAVQEYIDKISYKSSVKKLFSHHGASGLNNAIGLKTAVREAVEAGQSSSQILLIIMSLEKSSFETERSLRPILENRLQLLGGGTVEQLQASISMQERMSQAAPAPRPSSSSG